MDDPVIHLGMKKIDVWPASQEAESRGDPTIFVTHFDDIDEFHPRLVAKILEFEEQQRLRKRYFRGACGTKVHHIEKWGFSEADLINARAIALFKNVLNYKQAAVDLSWVNIYRSSDYCMPHSHVRSTASVVYFVDTGDQGDKDEVGGRFAFVDPRLGTCCQDQDQCMTTPYLPEMTAGTMIIFPSQLVHAVNPYTGVKPRITMSWNINQFAIPGPPLPPEAQA